MKRSLELVGLGLFICLAPGGLARGQVAISVSPSLPSDTAGGLGGYTAASGGLRVASVNRTQLARNGGPARCCRPKSEIRSGRRPTGVADVSRQSRNLQSYQGRRASRLLRDGAGLGLRHSAGLFSRNPISASLSWTGRARLASLKMIPDLLVCPSAARSVSTSATSRSRLTSSRSISLHMWRLPLRYGERDREFAMALLQAGFSPGLAVRCLHNLANRSHPRSGRVLPGQRCRRDRLYAAAIPGHHRPFGPADRAWHAAA